MMEARLSLPLIRKQSSVTSLQYEQNSVLRRIPTRIRAPPLLVTRLSSAQKLRRDKTFASANTAISKALNDVYDEFVDVKTSEVDETIEKTESFLYSITHRINKNRHNLKFGTPFTSGPAINGLCNKHSCKHITVYLPLKFKDFRLRDDFEGYTCIHTSRNPSFDRFQSIRSDVHRNLLSPIKINIAIHELLSHICQSVGRGRVLPYSTDKSDHRQEIHTIVIILDECVRVTVMPCLYRRGLKKDDDGTIYVTRPYLYDKNPNSDTLWRYDNPSRAQRVIEAMNRADRGVRSKALRLVHTCIEMDSTLQLCPQNVVTTVLYDMFDEDVDKLPSWQTLDLEKCFLNILTSWQQCMSSGVLYHPFTAGLNVLSGMDSKSRQLLKNRIGRLLGNKRELLRLLRQK